MPSFIPDPANVARSLLAIEVTLLIVGAAGLALIRFQGHELLSVQTASMLPTIRPGDALIVASVSPNQLHIGDIISYRSPRDPTVIISHRLVSIDPKTGWLTARGDALRSPDPVFPPRLLIGHATALAPRLGTVLNALRHPISIALTIYVPAGLIVWAEVGRLARTYTRPFYSVRL